jgi:putative membrane protein
MNFFGSRFRLSIFLLVAVYLVGIVTVLSGHTDALMTLTPFNLLFASALLIYNAEGMNRKYFIWFSVVAIAGFLLEVAGVKTGMIFGEYEYGRTLGIKLFEVPLIIGLNWAVLVFVTAAILQGIKWPAWLKATGASSLMLLYDFLLEPVAIRFDFWTWAGGSIPVQNYAAWWIIAFFMLLGAFYFVENLKNRIAFYIVAIQALFFIILILDQGLSIG